MNFAASGAPFSASRASSSAWTLTPLLTVAIAMVSPPVHDGVGGSRPAEAPNHTSAHERAGDARRYDRGDGHAQRQRPLPGSVGTVETQFLDLPEPLALDCGRTLHPVRIAYETYGTLSPARDNVILVCHALSGDAHAAGFAKTPPAESTRDGFAAEDRDGARGKGLGWWDGMIGPGKAFDTDRFFVVCTNLLGGCRGTTGPSSIEPGDRQAVRRRTSRSSPSPTWCAPSARSSTSSASSGWRPSPADRSAACRRSSGRSSIPIRWTRSSRSPAPTRSSRRASPGTRSRATRSWPTRRGRAATTTAPAASPTPAWAWRGWSATSRICRRSRSATSSAGGCSSPTTSATR